MKRSIFPILAILFCSISCSQRNESIVESELVSELYLQSIIADEKIRIESLSQTLNDSINDFNKRSDEIRKVFNSTKDDLINFCGGIDENGDPIDPYNTERVATFFIHMKYGMELRNSFISYEKFLQEAGLNFTEFSRDAHEIEVLKNIPSIKNKLFYEYNFDDISLCQAISRLTIFELHVTLLQKEYLRMKLNGM